MSIKIIRNVTSYVSVKMTVDGEKYDFKDKDGKQVTGVTKESIKIKTPYGGLNLRPIELKGIISLAKDVEFMNELNERVKSSGN